MMLLIDVIYSKGHTERPRDKCFADGEVHSYYLQNQNSDKQSKIDPRGIANDNFNENVVNSTCDTNGCKRSHSSKILEIGMILGEKMLYFDFRCHIVEEFNKGIYDYIIATDENIEHGGSKNSGCILLTNIF